MARAEKYAQRKFDINTIAEKIIVSVSLIHCNIVFYIYVRVFFNPNQAVLGCDPLCTVELAYKQRVLDINRVKFNGNFIFSE